MQNPWINRIRGEAVGRFTPEQAKAWTTCGGEEKPRARQKGSQVSETPSEACARTAVGRML